MNNLTLQNMNGVAGLGQSQPYEWGAGPMPWDGQLTPDYATERILPDIEANEFWTERRVPEPGEAWRADATAAVKAVTPSNDARDLPRYANPIIQLPIRDFSREYPHVYIPYEDVHSVISRELPPMVPGYATAPYAIDEEARAIEAVMPAPSVAPEAAAYDVSGFLTFQQAQRAGLSGEVDVVGDTGTLWKIRNLPPRLQRQVVERAVLWGVQRGVEDARAMGGGMGALGEDTLTAAISLAVQKAIQPLVPVLGQQLLAIAEPAAQKAAEIVGPAVKEQLEAKLPTFAIATGIVAGILAVAGMGLLGTYVVRKVRKSS